MSSFFSVCICSSSLVLVQYFQPDLFLSFSASHSETSINSVYQILRLLAWLFIYRWSITSQILDFIYWMVTIFIFDAWHDSANQQFFVTLFVLDVANCSAFFKFSFFSTTMWKNCKTCGQMRPRVISCKGGRLYQEIWTDFHSLLQAFQFRVNLALYHEHSYRSLTFSRRSTTKLKVQRNPLLKYSDKLAIVLEVTSAFNTK